MNKTFAVMALLPALAFSAPALAADLYTANSTVPHNAGYDWTGFYAGVHGGFTAKDEVPMPFGDASDWLAGVHLGGDVQTGPLVLGGVIEADYSADLAHDIGGGAALRQEWSGAAKARVGVAVDRLLAYGTAGIALARFEGESGATTADDWTTGHVFGGGVEFAVLDNLSVNLEYNQTRFDGVKSTVGNADQSNDLVNHAVRTGLSFRF